VLVADPSRTHLVLKWKASRDLTDIVSSAWHWMQRKNKVMVEAETPLAVAS
jgi:UDP-glucose 4-epimerase